MRRLLLALTVLAVLPAGAQARYLHMADAQRAVGRFIPREARDTDARSGDLRHCWRGGTHVIDCAVDFYAVTGVFDTNGIPTEWIVMTEIVTAVQRGHRIIVISPLA